MTWLLTHTGRQHYLAGAAATHPDNVPNMAEIAHALSQINRFTGHACRPYSVAEHSLLVADIAHSMGASKLGELCALMHDAHECIVGDVATPVKQAIGAAWGEFEAIHENHLRLHLGIAEIFEHHRAMVKQCDLISLATERRDLLPFDPLEHDPWPVLDGYGTRIYPWGQTTLMTPSQVLRTPREWAHKFTQRATQLFQFLPQNT